MNLTRLFESGDLGRLSHGVYKIAGAPGGQYEDLRAACRPLVRWVTLGSDAQPGLGIVLSAPHAGYTVRIAQAPAA